MFEEIELDITRRTWKENKAVLKTLLKYWKSLPEKRKNKRCAVERYFCAKHRKLVESPGDPTMFDCDVFEALGLPTDAEAYDRLKILAGVRQSFGEVVS